MPRRRDVKCSSCGRLIWRHTTSLPPGQATCRPCRRKASNERLAEQRDQAQSKLKDLECVACGQPFRQHRINQIYCTAECRESHRGWGTRDTTTTERGYGAKHRRERERWRPTVEAGHATCTICRQPIAADAEWHLDHTPDRTEYRGPAHAKCNRDDGAARGRATYAARGRGQSPRRTRR